MERSDGSNKVHLNEGTDILMKNIKHTTKRDLVKKLLYTLVTFIESTEEFEIQLQQFLSNLENDADTSSFYN